MKMIGSVYRDGWGPGIWKWLFKIGWQVLWGGTRGCNAVVLSSGYVCGPQKPEKAVLNDRWIRSS